MFWRLGLLEAIRPVAAPAKINVECKRELLSKRGVDFSDFSSRKLLYEVYSRYVQGEREFKNLEEGVLYEKIKDLLDTSGGDLAV